MPAITMNTMTTHWEAAANSVSEPETGMKPPVGSVANATETASNSPIRSSIPTTPNSVRTRCEDDASARRRGATACAPSCGSARRASRSRSRASPIRGAGGRRPAAAAGPRAARTMIPMPPTHCVNCRHRRSEWSTASTFVRIDDPVVVKPDIDSKNASTGLVELRVAGEEVRDRAEARRRAAR